MKQNEKLNGGPKNKIEGWMRDIFPLSETDRCEIAEAICHDDASSIQTQITIIRDENVIHSYTVEKPVTLIKKRDVVRLKLLEAGNRNRSIWGFILRFFAWWFAFAGIYSMAGVCPCCGQMGCPVGASGAGVLGGIGALCMQNWKHFIYHMKNKRGKGTNLQ
jgi:hypothetical protein